MQSHHDEAAHDAGPVASTAPVVVSADVLAAWLGLEASDAVPPSPGGLAFADAQAHRPHRLVLLDVRYTALGGPDHEAYHQGHLPSAVFVSLPSSLAGQPGPGTGRHPLPDEDDFTETVRMWGIDEGDTVVVYDDDRGLSAARAWWLLRHAGLSDTLLLDGGLGAWRAAGLPLQSGEVIPVPGSARAEWGKMPVVDAAGAAALAHEGLLLDARTEQRYAGESEPLDPVAGHIPGAVSLPTGGNLAADGRFLPVAELAARFEAAEVTEGLPVGVYCGSGVTAAHQVLAMAMAGRHGVALYPGSWSEWIQDEGRGVAVGASPDGD